MRRAVLTVLAVGALATATGSAAAQDRPAAVPIDSVLPPLRVDAGRLRPRGTLYDVLVTGDSGTQHVGWHTVWVHHATFAGRPAWEVLERRESHPPFAVYVTQDSTVLHRDTLLPLRWEAVTGEARLVAAFANDSAYGGATTPRARSSFTVGARGAAVTSEGSLDVLLQTAPLAEGWTAATTLLLADLSGARAVGVTLRVERTESLEIPAGRFDAWVVRATLPGAERTLWLDRATQLVLKTSETPPHMGGRLVERVFVGGY